MTADMTFPRLEKVCVPEEATTRQAIEAIDAGAVEIALVVGPGRELIGTVSDGDVRRALLGGMELDDPVSPIVSRTPVVAAPGTSREVLLRLMIEHGIEQVPLVNDGVLVDLAFIRDLVLPETSEEPVVIMAGGQGARLRPLTDDTPKPMLPVGDRPLLETILDQIRQAGFRRVFMAVNYRAEVIEEHFGDGNAHGVEITYLREPRQLGTAGALKLVDEDIDRPFLVINADLLTNVSLSSLMRFHSDESNIVTIGVRKYCLQVPYGVVDLDSTRVERMREKPTLDFYVNAGLYAVNPEAVALLPTDREQFDMTDVVDAAIASGRRVGGFPIREFWLDIGQFSDYERANDDHATHFAAR
jgi:dTDP-glucose pyrophosphorylase